MQGAVVRIALLYQCASWVTMCAAPVADHRVVDAFAALPDAALEAASRLRVIFRHASVGGTINDGLDCLQGTRDHPAVCQEHPNYRYDRRNWVFQPRGNSGWYGKIDDFVTETENQLEDGDVFCFKFCYLDGLDGLREPCGSPLDPVMVDQAWEYLRDSMETVEEAYPDKIFIWWTIPLTQVGQSCTEHLNEQIRSHCRENDKPLFDIADIECHAADGTRATNEHGREIALQEFCGEQRPDAQACHPNWDGKVRLAQAFWWLLTQLGGREVEITFRRGDVNTDGETDIADAIALLAHLFAHAGSLACDDAADTNDDGKLDISDAVMELLFLFTPDQTPAPPFGECGGDPTGDALLCSSFAPCA